MQPVHLGAQVDVFHAWIVLICMTDGLRAAIYVLIQYPSVSHARPILEETTALSAAETLFIFQVETASAALHLSPTASRAAAVPSASPASTIYTMSTSMASVTPAQTTSATASRVNQTSASPTSTAPPASPWLTSSTARGCARAAKQICPFA